MKNYRLTYSFFFWSVADKTNRTVWRFLKNDREARAFAGGLRAAGCKCIQITSALTLATN